MPDDPLEPKPEMILKMSDLTHEEQVQLLGEPLTKELEEVSKKPRKANNYWTARRNHTPMRSD